MNEELDQSVAAPIADISPINGIFSENFAKISNIE